MEKIYKDYIYHVNGNCALAELSQKPEYELSIPFGSPDHYRSIVPPYLSNYVRAISNKTGHDSLTVLMGILSTISISTNGKYSIQVNQDWTEQMCLYVLTMSGPGTNKT
ncbi:MAG: DUF3987 domain-containing protein, partial [Rickettsiales bacterium]|nr:DUF3987 domain-containing protein [Rickettsiales bacterium]